MILSYFAQKSSKIFLRVVQCRNLRKRGASHGTYATDPARRSAADLSRRLRRLRRWRRRAHHPARLSHAGIPAHLAAGTNKVVNGCGTLTATTKYFRSGKILLRPAIVAAVGALIGSALGTELAAVISEKALETLMLVALPCVAVFLTVKKDFGKDIPEEERPVYSVKREVVTAALIGLVFGCYDGFWAPAREPL